jgi:radical SAM protein with 4Fe4S-binding SPASM domain
VRLRLCLRRVRLRLRRRRPLSLLSSWKRSSPLPAPRPGLHDYAWSRDGASARLHLRVEPDGQALLMVNADRVVHLNPTAALITWLLLEGRDAPAAAAELRRRFRIRRSQAEADTREVAATLEALAAPDGPCPVHDLDLEILPPFSQRPSAPYRMDLALTYRCNDACAHCYNARPRDYPELDTTTWKTILGQLRAIGIPHVCFTGGEPTLRNDLPELVAHAQGLGQVTGLLTNGRRLSDPRFVDALAEAGLDHVQVTLESSREAVHDAMVGASGAWRQTVDGIRRALQAGFYLMTNTTLLEANAPHLDETIDFLASLGVPTVGCNALIHSGHGAHVGSGIAERSLPGLLQVARRRTDANGQRLIWYTPTQYCHFDPVQMDLGVKGCTAALYNLCIEPDGEVIPCQSYYQSIGNILSDPWDSIWNHDLAVQLREHRFAPEACQGCAILTECGGGCPLLLPVQAPQRLAVPTSVP